jgi:hypothetical protein
VGFLLGRHLGLIGLAVAVPVVVLASYVASICIYGGSEFHRHTENLVIFVPPFALATLIGWLVGKFNKAKPPSATSK